MSTKLPKILVMCPGDAVTGGPEVLHQLVHELRDQGRDAAICYFPIEQVFDVPEPYRPYDLKVERFADEPGQIVVVPEIATRLLDRVRFSRGVVWWLSVDNYFGRTAQGLLRDFHGYLLTRFVAQRRPLQTLRNFDHLAQSEYARSFLRDNGIEALMLTDYLADEHFALRDETEGRRDWIAYNPKKGVPVIRKLHRLLPDLKFVPIQNMSKQQVAHLLSSVKIYVDFGHHPGKDRLPREAAMAGACVITGIRGSAAFEDDVSIPVQYKLDENAPSLAVQFDEIAQSIFRNFDTHSGQMESYRDAIRSERSTFTMQVHEVFKALTQA